MTYLPFFFCSEKTLKVVGDKIGVWLKCPSLKSLVVYTVAIPLKSIFQMMNTQLRPWRSQKKLLELSFQ